MLRKEDKNATRVAKHTRLRFNISGTAEKPRLNVYRSTSHIYAQLIDDVKGVTICSSSSLDVKLAPSLVGKTKSEQAYLVGVDVAKKAIKKGINNVVFDRGGYIYTGRVQKVAEGARSANLIF